MGLVSLSHLLTAGTQAIGEQVRANDDAIVAVVNGFIDDSNVAVGANISGLKINNVEGLRIRNDRLDNACVDSRVLDDDPAVGSPTAAVTANHIRGGAVTTEKLAAGAVTTAKITALNVTSGELGPQAVLSGKIKIVASTDYTPGGTIIAGASNEPPILASGLGVPLFVEMRRAGAPTGLNYGFLTTNIVLDTGASTYYLIISNTGPSNVNVAGLTWRLYYISAT